MSKKEDLDVTVANVFNLGHIKKTVKVVSETFAAFQPFLEKPTWWNMGRSLMTVTKTLIEEFEVWPDVYFEDDEKWTAPYSREFVPLILPLIQGHKFTSLKSNEGAMVIRLLDVEGIAMGYVFNTKNNSADMIYVDTTKVEQAKAYFKKLLWDQHKDSSLVMRNNRKTSSYGNEPRVVFDVDNNISALPSKRADDYSVYLNKCLVANVPRSVMFYGPPGTGKSTMARTLVDKLNLRSFRIRVEDVGYIDASTIFEAVNIFAPDVVILDDFDRCSQQTQLLEMLEHFQKQVKLVIATVNNRNDLDEAILRPGRFDELIYVDSMEEPVIRNMLGPDNQDAYDLVKGWPIAFINEYVKRRQFLTHEETETSLKELVHRVSRLRNYQDSFDNESDFMDKLASDEKSDEVPENPSVDDE